MIDWRTVFIGVIAVSTLVTAVVQIAMILAVVRLVKRLEHLAARLESDLTPLVGYLNSIGRDASRIAALASSQVDRFDQLVVGVIGRLDDVVHGLRGNMTAPLRQGAAMLAAFRAVLGVVRDVRSRRARSRSDDEDPLFI